MFLNVIFVVLIYNFSNANEPTAKQFSTPCFAAVDYLNNKDKNIEPNKEAIFGLAYITGFRQGLITSQVFNADNQTIGKDALCIPPEVSNGEILIVVAKWLKSNPERLNNIALAEIVLALNKAFPCPDD